MASSTSWCYTGVRHRGGSRKARAHLCACPPDWFGPYDSYVKLILAGILDGLYFENDLFDAFSLLFSVLGSDFRVDDVPFARPGLVRLSCLSLSLGRTTRRTRSTYSPLHSFGTWSRTVASGSRTRTAGAGRQDSRSTEMHQDEPVVEEMTGKAVVGWSEASPSSGRPAHHLCPGFGFRDD